MNNLVLIWAQFVACAGVIGIAGFHLSRYGYVIAQRTGLTGSWIGLALLATVTSLPELVTGIASVTIAHAPNVALGDALGSCVVNLLFLVLIDLAFRKAPIWQRASEGHVLAAAFGVVMLGFALISLLMSRMPKVSAVSTTPSGFSMASPVILILYLVAMRTIFVYERANAPVPDAREVMGASLPALHQAVLRFALAAVAVAIAGLWLPFAAVDLAEQMGWTRSFVGTLFVSLATSLPELAVTLSALRIGALDMAIANLLGSNLFNVAIVAVDDLCYRQGSLLADASPVHSITAASATTMTGLTLVGLFLRPQSRVLRTVGWVSVGMAAVYVLNTYFLYWHGD